VGPESGAGVAGTAPDPADRYAVVVVEPETPGNVGTIARAMKNFGFADLRLVNPPPLERDGEAYGFAGHAREDVLPNATETTFDEVVADFHTIGFTAITGEDARRHVRFPFVTPRELADDLAGVDVPAAFVFGREGRGLRNDELDRLDRICSIPASPEYPVLNLGQAATVALYELRHLALGPDGDHLPDVEGERAAPADVERLYGFLDGFLAAVEHRDHKRAKAGRLFRRLLGRAHPTDREVATLTGLFRKATAKLEGRHRSGSEAADGKGKGEGEGNGDADGDDR
jgi:TrmH family RNA methyltransferase